MAFRFRAALWYWRVRSVGMSRRQWNETMWLLLAWIISAVTIPATFVLLIAALTVGLVGWPLWWAVDRFSWRRMPLDEREKIWLEVRGNDPL